METTFAIYEDTHYTMQTPFGSRTIIKHDRIDSNTIDIPEDIAKEINKHYIFNTETYCEGIGAVPVQDEHGNMYPQTLKFLFTEDVCDIKVAFERFEEFLQRKVEDIEKEQKEQQSLITPATEQDLQMINRLREEEAQGGGGSIIL
jgi:hypothetical protein